MTIRKKKAGNPHADKLDISIPGWQESEIEAKKFLQTRAKRKVVGDKAFGVVFTPTRFCNLRCAHCAVAAPHKAAELKDGEYELSHDDSILIIEKVAGYSRRQKVPVFFMFGGGEPTLRSDFISLLEKANQVFGKASIGFCTNGTFRSWEYLQKAASNVGLFEVSLDGFEKYHNKWRGAGWSRLNGSPYSITLEVISNAVKEIPSALEVTSVVTRENMETLPDFSRFLRDSIGVSNYSVHRPVSVGRLANRKEIFPSKAEYFHFFVEMAKVAQEDSSFKIHVHHSLESIYSAIFLGKDIHRSTLPLASSRHSIGISWDGFVHFDPWALVEPFSSWSPGSLLSDGVEIENLVDSPGSILGLVAAAKRDNVRCEQCDENCTGGLRLLAMADYFSGRDNEIDGDVSKLMAALSCKDPACPLA